VAAAHLASLSLGKRTADVEGERWEGEAETEPETEVEEKEKGGVRKEVVGSTLFIFWFSQALLPSHS
jgi:hypothetical protein